MSTSFYCDYEGEPTLARYACLKGNICTHVSETYLTEHMISIAQDYTNIVDLHDIDNIRPVNDHTKQQEAQQLFITMDVNQDKATIKTGPSFDAWLNNDHDTTPFPSVCFVGRTGAGKLHLIAGLLAPERFVNPDVPRPLVGSFKSCSTTSNNIHMYHRTPAHGHAYAMLDCEGIDGNLPLTLESKNTSYPEPHMLQDQRQETVNNAYPHLMYTFCSVFVFVFDGSIAESGTVGDLLLQFARHTTENTPHDDDGFRPALCIVFDRIPNDQYRALIENEDMTSVWRDNNPRLYKKLEQYYASIKVMLMPRLSVRTTMAWRKQINGLDHFLMEHGQVTHPLLSDKTQCAKHFWAPSTHSTPTNKQNSPFNKQCPYLTIARTTQVTPK